MPDEERTPEDEGLPDLHDEEMAEPADERPAASRDRVTASEQRQGETVRERHARERPDAEPGSSGRQTPGRTVEETEDGRDVTKELEADETGDRRALEPEEDAVREE